MRRDITDFLADRKGSAMTEYALLLAAFAIGILSALSALSQTLAGLYQAILTGLTSLTGGP